jgi:hypothetical protein
MSAKIHHSALFLSALISLIYAVCWVPFSFFFDKIILFSINHQVPPTKLHFLIGSLYLSITTFLVFILMKKQIRQTALLRSKLTTADEILESRVKQRIAEIEKSFGDIKKLTGIIPICANCKDIRNGSGQWEKIETYICKHSDADFSHGLCPDCDKELYGDRRMHFKKIARQYS